MLCGERKYFHDNHVDILRQRPMCRYTIKEGNIWIFTWTGPRGKKMKALDNAQKLVK